MRRRSFAALLAFGAGLAVAFGARTSRADDLVKVETEDTADHTEYAGFPVVGGSTDVGIQLGGAGTITHVGDSFRPYWWKVDGLVSLSVKGGPRGTEIVQQSHAMRWDIPGGANGKVRLMPAVFYDRTINSGYFGLGNASPVIPGKNGEIGDRYQYIQEEASTRINARTPLGGPFSTMYGWQLRYANPRAYPESKLAVDAATRQPDGTPLIRGVQPLGIATLNAGIIYDTRDDELFPHSGAFHRAAFRISGATPTSSGVYWSGLDIIYRDFRRLPGTFVLATRLMIDAMAGHVPFYDLSQGQAFDPNDMPGGALGVRGVPRGRYAGLLKVVGNVELRRIHGAFHVFHSKFQVGTTAFFDFGRVWTDYTFDNPRDGTGLGIKYGVGGGPFIIWDTAALLCVNVAYSPDATAANPGFPLGIYVQEGLTF